MDGLGGGREGKSDGPLGQERTAVSPPGDGIEATQETNAKQLPSVSRVVFRCLPPPMNYRKSFRHRLPLKAKSSSCVVRAFVLRSTPDNRKNTRNSAMAFFHTRVALPIRAVFGNLICENWKVGFDHMFGISAIFSSLFPKSIAPQGSAVAHLASWMGTFFGHLDQLPG